MKMMKGGEMHKKKKKLREKRTVKEQRKVAKEVKRWIQKLFYSTVNHYWASSNDHLKAEIVSAQIFIYLSSFNKVQLFG